MKRILTYIAMAIMALSAISCKEETKKKVLLPNISGKAGEVIVVIPKAEWEGIVGNTLRDTLACECPYLPQREPHQQQLSSFIQRYVRQPTCPLQHAPGQPPKAEHLTVLAGVIAADPAKIQLRLMGGVLRHQQDLAAAVSQSADLPENIVGFSRFGAACQNGQHRVFPSFPSQF